MEENFHRRLEREAAEKVKAALLLTVPETQEDIGCEGFFDPWDIFPVFYGSYSGAFDAVALDVLRAMQAEEFKVEELAHQMFREYLCRAGLCDYGSSPRVCFPSMDFKPLLPALIEKWAAYSRVQWDEDVTA